MKVPWLALGAPPTLLCAALPAGGAPPPRAVSFPTADGGTVHADLHGRGGRAVVLAHGMAFDKGSWEPFADTLAAHGFQALAIDFRGYGQSRAGSRERALDEDVLAAIRYLHGHGAKSVAVLGGSMGGGASAQAATEARAGEIDRLLLLSPVSIEHPERMRAGAILYVASRNERMALGIREQYGRAPQPKRLVLLDGDAHAQNIFRTDMGPRLTRVLLDFLGDESPAAADSGAGPSAP